MDKKLTIFLDKDGVLLNYRENLFDDNSYEFIKYLVETDEIDVIWSTCWYRVSPPPKYVDIEWYETLANDSSSNPKFKSVNTDKSLFYNILQQLFDKAKWFEWYENKTNLIKHCETKDFIFIEDGLCKREIKDLEDWGYDLSKVYFYIDLEKEENNLLSAKRFIEQRLKYI